MDTLVEGFSTSVNGFEFNHPSISAPSNPNHVTGQHTHTQIPDLSDGSPPLEASLSSSLSSPSGVSSDGDCSEEREFPDEVLKYISEMLMDEEDLQNKPPMFHDSSALQAAEKSFYDVLVEKHPPFPTNHPADESDRIHDQGGFEPFLRQSSLIVDPTLQSIASSSNFDDVVNGRGDSHVSPFQILDSSTGNQWVSQSGGEQGEVTHFLPGAEKNVRDYSPNGSREKKNHSREDSDYGQEGRSYKQLASYAEDSEESKMFDDVLLWPIGSALCPVEEDLQKVVQNGQLTGPKRGRPRGKKQDNGRELVDLRGLLTHCAQAVATNNTRTVDELLKQIRQHSSPHGDGIERLAHYFANALEARWAGTGTTRYTDFTAKRISSADILEAYHLYVTACPFTKMGNIFANKSIGKLAEGATKLHIIDFGVLYGYQWPCLIQHLSTRRGGPPKLCITGIDLPQPGFRPAERVQEAGRRLSNYCKRFNVPFEYNAIAKKWDAVQLEELKIDRDELLVVNCLDRLRNVPDETVVADCPRDAVLNLIKRINPDMFIHGIVNGNYSAPFFVTRFREALFHFSALFDMFDAAAQREDQARLMFEQEIFGRDTMNVIACEGTARIERPETYKQWHVRNLRAGLRPLPLCQDSVKQVTSKVKKCYHKDFMVDQDSNWMLHGWKGRVLFAVSCWKAVQE